MKWSIRTPSDVSRSYAWTGASPAPNRKNRMVVNPTPDAASNIFPERRWERWHLNGWVGIVELTASGWFRGYAQDALGQRSASIDENTDFEAVTAAVDALVLGLATHECACPAWQELR